MTLGNIYALLWIFLLHKPFHPASFIPRRHKVVSGKHGGTGRRGLCPGGGGEREKEKSSLCHVTLTDRCWKTDLPPLPLQTFVFRSCLFLHGSNARRCEPDAGRTVCRLERVTRATLPLPRASSCLGVPSRLNE